MARPFKQGIDYFSLDVDYYMDIRFIRLRTEFGVTGEIIALRLFCEIYRTGYFTEWSDNLKFAMADSLHVKPNLITEVVNGMVRCGLFDGEMFKRHSVLTSERIQRGWHAATARRRDRDTGRYWLIDGDNDCDNTEEDDNCMQKQTNQIKANQTKVNDVKRNAPESMRPDGAQRSHDDVCELFSMYYGRRDISKLMGLCDEYGCAAVYDAVDRAGDQVKYQPFNYVKRILEADRELEEERRGCC